MHESHPSQSLHARTSYTFSYQHKDFIKNFRFARVKRRIKGKERIMQVGLDYVLEDGDVVEVVC